jgi:hypothetical protein
MTRSSAGLRTKGKNMNEDDCSINNIRIGCEELEKLKVCKFV